MFHKYTCVLIFHLKRNVFLIFSFKTSPYDEPIPDLKASSDEPKPDYPVYDWESKATKVLPPVVPSSFGSSS